MLARDLLTVMSTMRTPLTEAGREGMRQPGVLGWLGITTRARKIDFVACVVSIVLAALTGMLANYEHRSPWSSWK